MKAFTRDYRISGDYHPLWSQYFGGMKPCVLDIETTGLDRNRCRVILTGLLTPIDGGVRATQFLAENHCEEGKVLDATIEFLDSEGIDYLITYNGAAFDVPFLNTRLERCFAGRQIGMYDFDLLRFLRMTTCLKARTGSLSQKSVENYYGILSDRGDTISGRESVMLFDQYSLTGNSTIEKIILTHNREDIVHLSRLMYHVMRDLGSICTAYVSRGFDDAESFRGHDNSEGPDAAGAYDLHSAMASYGFPAAGGRLSVRPSIKAKTGGRSAGKGNGSLASDQDAKGILRVTGEQIFDPVSCAFFPDADVPVTAMFSASSSSFEIEAPIAFHGNDSYMDISFLLGGALFKSPNLKKHAASPEREEAGRQLSMPADSSVHRAIDTIGSLRSDPDCVNDYLILEPRTINLVSRALAEVYISLS